MSKNIKNLYIPVSTKFLLSHLFSILWVALSIYLSIPWLKDLAKVITMPIAIIVITGIAYIPGYFNAILIISLLFDKQPSFKTLSPKRELTILIACRNEEDRIEDTLKYIAKQDYMGKIKIIVIDNGSTDNTSINAANAGEKFNLDVTVIYEKNPGKFNALNTGLKYVATDLMITLDADTLLQSSAIKYIVSRMESAPNDVCAVAGNILVRNGRDNIVTKIQEWDYFLAISSVKRFQGLYQGTLVAQGAYSLYKTDAIRSIGGWSDAIGEDIVLTWNFLRNDWKVYFEPLSVAFTEVPTTLKHFARQRSRWARGMIEALKSTKPWEHPIAYVRYLTGVNLLMPYIDAVYTFCWLPSLVLAFFGIYYIVGIMTLYVLPLTFLSYYIIYKYQKNVFKSLNLKIRKNIIGFFLFVLCYQMIMSPVSVWGYLEEFLKLERVWK